MFASLFRSEGMDRSPWGSFWFEPVSRMTGSGMRVNAASAMALPTVYACVRVRAESFASLRFGLFRPKVGGGRTRVTDHWLYRLFVKAPNRFQNPFEFAAMLEGHLALRGNAFCQITEDGAGGIAELLPLHPDRMRAELLDNGSYRYKYTDQNGRTIYYARNEIWHLRGLSADGIMGMSLVEVAREAIGEGLSMQAYSSRFFANDAKPGGGWIEFPNKFADKAAKATFRESWQELQGGANRGKVAVLEQGMKYHELGQNNKDAQFTEARADKAKEIARIFRIPPHKVGIMDDATFSNIEQQNIEFWMDSMTPEARLWQSSIEYFLLGPDSDLEVEYDIREMMRGDGQARAVRISTLVMAGVMLRNEGRHEEGYDPIDGLDDPLQPLNMGVVGQVPPPGAKPANAPPADEPTDDGGADARLQTLVHGNAVRMARRVVAGKPPTATALAEALAVQLEAAAVWLAKHETLPADAHEDEITVSLLALGEIT